MSHQTSSNAQVEKEQQIVKDAAVDMVQGVRKVREEGLSTPSMPTTQGTLHQLDKAEAIVDSAQHSLRGQQTGGKGQEVMADIKDVLEDHKAIVRKNEGDIIQRILMNSSIFLHDITGDSSMQGLFSNWQSLSGSLFNSGNMSDILASGTEILKNLKDTEEFLHLASEMLNMLKLLIAQGQEKFTENRSGNLAEIQAAVQTQRRELMEDLVDLLRTLAANEIWKSLTARAKNKTRQLKGETKEVANDMVNRVLDSKATEQLINDVRTFLQRLVGNEMDVNAFFNALAQVLYDFSDNQELADLFYDIQAELQDVADHPTALDDQVVKKKLEDLSAHAQLAFDKVLNSPSFVKVRAETHHLMESIMKEPANARLVNDTKKLWHDITSDAPGQLFDPALLQGVRQMIIPMFLDHLSNVPIPAIYDSGEMMGKYDYSLNNIKLDVPEMLPENIHLRFDHEMDANIKNLSAANQRTFIFLEARDIHIHLHDVAWSYHRHRLPRYTDSGLVNVDTEGRGLILRLKMELTNDTHNNHLVEIHAARVIIDRFHVTFAESKHNKMYKMMTHLFQTRIKHAVEDALESKLKDFGSTLNSKIIAMLSDARSKSRDYQGLATQKLEQVKVSAMEFKQQAIDTKERAKDRMDSATTQAKEKFSEHSENAKEVLREQAQRATGEQHPEAIVQEAKQEVKERAKGAITIAAERATSMIDQQQQKIQEQRLEKQFDKAINLDENKTNWNYNPTEAPISGNNEMKEMREMKDLHSAPVSSSLPESQEAREDRDRLELQQAQRKQQAGSSDVPLGFVAPEGSNQTTSADITYGLHSGIPSFDAASPVSEHKKEHTEQKTSLAKQGL